MLPTPEPLTDEQFDEMFPDWGAVEDALVEAGKNRFPEDSEE